MKFRKIYELNNVSYALGVLNNTFYLRITHYDFIPKIRWGLFKRKEVIKRIKAYEYLMPLSASVHIAMLRTLMLRKVGEEEIFGDIVDIYQRIDDTDHTIIMRDFKELLAKADDGNRFKTPVLPKNKVARGIKNEGYHYLGEETINKINKVHTLYKVSPVEGYLTVAIVNEMGKPNDMDTTDVIITQMTRDLIYTIFNYMGLTENEGE